MIRASIDGFHHPRAVRYRRGRDSPESYYRDSFDCDAIVASLLAPLGPDGDRRYTTAVFDYRIDAPVDLPQRDAPDDAILLFDGVFLLRPELREHWDFSIFVDVDFDETSRRAMKRDLELFGTAEEVYARYFVRYIPGQRIYLDEARPRETASVVVDNNDLDRPILHINHIPDADADSGARS